MVEETTVIYKAKNKTTRPKIQHLWTQETVQKWYRRHCGEYLKYLDLFQLHEITGRALLRITDDSLLRMGITNKNDREAIWREILKQKLKTDIMEIRDIELMNECTL